MMLLLATSLLILASISEGTEPKVVCYYTNWSVYRPELGRYPTSKIDPNLCTHLNYAFGSFTKESQLRPSDKYQDIDIDGYITFTGLKSVNPKLKTLLSIGGTAQGSSTFSHVASDPARRATFITNAIKFLRIHNFDGLDVDWTAPGTGRGSRPDDKANYVLLLKELSEKIKAEPGNNSPLLLSVTAQRDDGLDFAEINRNVDYMNVRGYDYHSAVDEAVNNHAPLFAPPDDIYNLNATVSYLIKRGADRSKLVIGIPTYGRTFTLTDPKESTIGSPATGPGERGKYTREQGFFAYYEICDNIKNDPGWTVVHPDPNSMGPYAVKGDQWVGYDDVDIVKKKVEYMKEEKLGGVFFWTIDNDDFLGTCHGKSYPLINAAKEALQNN